MTTITDAQGGRHIDIESRCATFTVGKGFTNEAYPIGHNCRQVTYGSFVLNMITPIKPSITATKAPVTMGKAWAMKWERKNGDIVDKMVAR